MTVAVGQEVFIERASDRWSRRVQNQEPDRATVTAIGRRWATVLRANSPRSERFDLETWELDRGEYDAWPRVFPSLAAFDEVHRKETAWERLWSLFRANPGIPTSISAAAVEEALRLLTPHGENEPAHKTPK